MLKFAIKRKTLDLFHEAVDNKDFLRTKLLIENCDKQKFVVDSLDNNGLTPLQRSCFLGNVRLVRLLVEAGAKTSIKDSEGWTVLHASAVAGNYAVVKYLIKIGVDLDAKTDGGELAIDLAENNNVVLLLFKSMVRKGMNGLVRQYLRRNPGSFQRILCELKKQDKLPHHIQITPPRRPRSLELPNVPHDPLYSGVVPEPTSEPPRGTFRRSLRGRKLTPIQPTLDDLTDDESDISVAPLSASKISSSLTSLSSLSSSSSAPSANTDWPDVIYAAHKSTRLSSSTASDDVTSPVKRVQFVGLPCCVAEANVNQVKKWFDAGKIMVNSLNENGVAPLHEAAYGNNITVIQFLLRRGADVNIQSKDGSTPLHAAVNGGSGRALTMLIDYGADLFIENDNGALPIEETEDEKFISIMQQAMTLM